nr:MAG TPA: head to tail adaptor [Caudoviricetes sp.]
MESSTVIESRLEFRRKALEQAQAAYLALLGGQVKSYAIGRRNLTRLDLPQLEDTIDKLEKEIDELEAVLRGGKRRKTVGAIPRDW